MEGKLEEGYPNYSPKFQGEVVVVVVVVEAVRAQGPAGVVEQCLRWYLYY